MLLLSGDVQKGQAGVLTSLTVRTVTTQATVNSKAAAAASVPSLAAGDSLGGVWVFRRNAATDAYTIVHALPRWSGIEGGDQTRTPLLTAVAWKDSVLIGGADDGRIAAWELTDGTPDC